MNTGMRSKRLNIGMCLAISVLAAGCDNSNTRPYDAGHRRNACIANLKQIQAAKEIWMQEQHKTTNDTAPESYLFGPSALIRRKPTCPDGGTYTIGKVGENAKCSFRNHKL